MEHKYSALHHQNIARFELEKIILDTAKSQGWSVGIPLTNEPARDEKIYLLKGGLLGMKRLRIKILISESQTAEMINQIFYSHDGPFNLATSYDAMEYITALSRGIEGRDLLKQFGHNDTVYKIGD